MTPVPRHRRRKRILLALAAFTVLVSGAGLWARYRPAQRFVPSVPAENELRIVTWNVGYFTPLRVKSAPADDSVSIVAVLRHTRAHLVVLQELGSSQQANAIAKALGDEWEARSVEAGHPSQFLAALAVFPIESAEVRKAGGKNMLGVRLRAPGGNDIFLLGLHAPHPGRGRNDTADYIRTGVSWAQERSESVRILAGDFNRHFSVKAGTEGQGLYHELSALCVDSTAGIGATYYARLRIDYVFHAPKTLAVVAPDTGLVDLPLRFSSVPGWRDHRPIVVTLRLENSWQASAAGQHLRPNLGSGFDSPGADSFKQTLLACLPSTALIGIEQQRLAAQGPRWIPPSSAP